MNRGKGRDKGIRTYQDDLVRVSLPSQVIACYVSIYPESGNFSVANEFQQGRNCRNAIPCVLRCGHVSSCIWGSNEAEDYDSVHT